MSLLRAATATNVDDHPLATATLHGTLVWVIREHASAKDVAAVQMRLERMLLWRSYAGLVVVVADGSWIPDQPSRRRTTSLLDELRDEFSFVAVLFEGNGLRVSLLRTFLSALSSSVKRSFPLRVFEQEQAMLRWVSAQMHDDLGRALGPARLRAIVTGLRGPDLR
jgi:hypothetical protein